MTPTPPQPDQRDDGHVEIAPGISVPSAVLRFHAVRSGGPGGQNVNKRATKVELRISPDDIPIENDARSRLRRAAGSRLTQSDELIIASDEHRTQHKNKQACLARLRRMIIHARQPPKKRIPTKPPRGARERRLREKREQKERKQRRRFRPDQ